MYGILDGRKRKRDIYYFVIITKYELGYMWRNINTSSTQDLSYI